MGFDVKFKWDISKVRTKHDRAQKSCQISMDENVLTDSNYFIPLDTGNLKGSARRNTVIGSGKVKWGGPYARRLYYNPQYNFRKDKNPNAGGLWFERAKSLHKQKWIREAQRIYNEYFNGR